MTARQNRALAVATIVLLVAVAGVAGAAPHAWSAASGENPRTFPDPAGDSGGAPDISSVAIGNSFAGIVSFAVSIANAGPLLRQDALVTLFVDADRDDSTGDGGFEYAIQGRGGLVQAVVGHWDGTQHVRVSAPSLVTSGPAGR